MCGIAIKLIEIAARKQAFTRPLKWAICAVISLSYLPLSLLAQDNIPAASDAAGAQLLQTAPFQQFVAKYIAAVNTKNRKALRALYDPVSRAVMATDQKDVSEVIEEALDDKIPAQHELVLSMIGPKDPLMFENVGAVYAKRPAALLQINYATDPNNSASTMLYVAQSGGNWFEVWAKPPDEDKVENTLQDAQDNEAQKEKGVQSSGVANYTYDPNPKTGATWLYQWEIRMTAADSKDRHYEMVQIDQPAGGAATTSIVADRTRFQPSDNGFIGFKLCIGDKPAPSLQMGTNKVEEPLLLSGLGNGFGEQKSITLPGTALGRVIPAEKGAPLVDGTLQLVRFESKDANGGQYSTDLVLRAAVQAPTGGDKFAAECTWDPDECNKPLIVPVGYHAWENGNGKYHIAREADPALGTIAITFQPDGALDPETVADARQVPLKIKGQQFTWRVYPTEVDGKPDIRKETLMPNILPRDKSGTNADFIWIHIDAATQQGIDTLTPIAGGIIRDCL